MRGRALVAHPLQPLRGGDAAWRLDRDHEPGLAVRFKRIDAHGRVLVVGKRMPNQCPDSLVVEAGVEKLGVCCGQSPEVQVEPACPPAPYLHRSEVAETGSRRPQLLRICTPAVDLESQ